MSVKPRRIVIRTSTDEEYDYFKWLLEAATDVINKDLKSFNFDATIDYEPEICITVRREDVENWLEEADEQTVDDFVDELDNRIDQEIDFFIEEFSARKDEESDDE
jgi:hypothetical protein